MLTWTLTKLNRYLLVVLYWKCSTLKGINSRLKIVDGKLKRKVNIDAEIGKASLSNFCIDVHFSLPCFFPLIFVDQKTESKVIDLFSLFLLNIIEGKKVSTMFTSLSFPIDFRWWKYMSMCFLISVEQKKSEHRCWNWKGLPFQFLHRCSLFFSLIFPIDLRWSKYRNRCSLLFKIRRIDEETTNQVRLTLLFTFRNIIDFAELKKMIKIGQGQFGVVYKAEYHASAVAVKQLKTNDDTTLAAQIEEFTKEILLMLYVKNFHCNILVHLRLIRMSSIWSVIVKIQCVLWLVRNVVNEIHFSVRVFGEWKSFNVSRKEQERFYEPKVNIHERWAWYTNKHL